MEQSRVEPNHPTNHPMFLFRAPSDRQLSLALAALRITIGTIFLRHGAQKLFTFGFAGVTGAFTQMGVPLPSVTGPFVAVLEFFGGIALVLGFLTRLIALGFVFDMLVAILLVQLKRGFSGYELEFTLLGSSLALVLAGGGRFSVDGLLSRPSAPAGGLA